MHFFLIFFSDYRMFSEASLRKMEGVNCLTILAMFGSKCVQTEILQSGCVLNGSILYSTIGQM